MEENYKHNLNEWIASVNILLKDLKERIDDISLSQEEYLIILSYQYKIIKELKERVNVLKNKQQEDVKWR